MTNESHTDCYPALKTAISKLEDQKREIERLTRERDVSRAAIEQLHAAVKTAQEVAARRLMEIEQLRAQLQQVVAIGFEAGVEAQKRSHEPKPCASFPEKK